MTAKTDHTCRLVQRARQCACGHAAGYIMFAAKRVYRRVDPVVDERCELRSVIRRVARVPTGNVNLPSTPAELPMNVPLLVTELRMLLIRRRAFVTASGRRAPSFKPHIPPTERPGRNMYEHVTGQRQ